MDTPTYSQAFELLRDLDQIYPVMTRLLSQSGDLTARDAREQCVRRICEVWSPTEFDTARAFARTFTSASAKLAPSHVEAMIYDVDHILRGEPYNCVVCGRERGLFCQGLADTQCAMIQYKRLIGEEQKMALTFDPTKIIGPGACNPPPKDEAVDHPAHYGGASDPYEVVKVAEAWGFDQDAYLFNVLKYIARAGKKPGEDIVRDLKKAAWYLARKIMRLGA